MPNFQIALHALVATLVDEGTLALRRMLGKILIALTCLSLGCAAGMADRPAFAQEFRANPAAPKWQQFCEDYDDHAEMKTAVRRLGGSGWEIVTFTMTDSTRPWLCYRRPES